MKIQQIQNKKLVKLADMKAGDCFLIPGEYREDYAWTGLCILTSHAQGLEEEKLLGCVELEHGHFQLMDPDARFERANVVVQILPDEEIQK